MQTARSVISLSIAPFYDVEAPISNPAVTQSSLIAVCIPPGIATFRVTGTDVSQAQTSGFPGGTAERDYHDGSPWARLVAQCTRSALGVLS